MVGSDYGFVYIGLILFVYFMANEINKTFEFSCDESVIIKKVSYSKAQNMEEHCLMQWRQLENTKESIGSVTLSKNKILLKRKKRLGAIMDFKRKSKLAKIMTIIFNIMRYFWSAFYRNLSD